MHWQATAGWLHNCRQRVDIRVVSDLKSQGVVLRGGKLVAVCAADLESGEELVGMAQDWFMANTSASDSGCVYEVETAAGTLLTNGVLAMAASLMTFQAQGFQGFLRAFAIEPAMSSNGTAMHTGFWLVRTHQTISDTKGH